METLTAAEIEQILDEGLVAHIGVIHRGAPYVSPMSYVHVKGAIAFRTLEGRRLEALRENPRVCVEVTRVDTESGDWWCVIADGGAEIIEDDISAGTFIAQLLHKYDQGLGQLFGVPDRPSPTPAYVVRIRLDNVEGRCSGRLFGRKTRPGRL